jgi:hypothetical protein
MNREQIESEIANLRYLRGRQLLHGKKSTQDEAIAALQQQLDGLADLEAEKLRVERQTAAKAREKELGKKNGRNSKR